MENKKSVLITIVVLLLIFTPLSIIGILTTNNIGIAEENPNHKFNYDGYLWFYDKNNELLSKYECQTEICDYATPIINDNTYNINYYKEGVVNKVSLINDKYTFLTDGSVIYLYAATTGSTLQTYKAIKTYNVNLTNNLYIIQNNEGLWGVLTVGDVLSSTLPFEYDFIGLINNTNNEGVLNTDKFIVQKNSKWYIVNNENSAITGQMEDPIVDYTNEYIFTKNGDKVRIYSYQNYEYLTNYNIKNYILKDNYVGIVTDNFLLIYDNLGTQYIKSIALSDNKSAIELEKNNNVLNIIINNDIIESIELN